MQTVKALEGTVRASQTFSVFTLATCAAMMASAWMSQYLIPKDAALALLGMTQPAFVGAVVACYFAFVLAPAALKAVKKKRESSTQEYHTSTSHGDAVHGDAAPVPFGNAGLTTVSGAATLGACAAAVVIAVVTFAYANLTVVKPLIGLARLSMGDKSAVRTVECNVLSVQRHPIVIAWGNPDVWVASCRLPGRPPRAFVVWGGKSLRQLRPGNVAVLKTLPANFVVNVEQQRNRLAH